MNNNIQDSTPKNKGEIEAMLLRAITSYLCQATETSPQIIGALQDCRLSIIGGNSDTISGAIVRLIEAIKGKGNARDLAPATAPLAPIAPVGPVPRRTSPEDPDFGTNVILALATPGKTAPPGQISKTSGAMGPPPTPADPQRLSVRILDSARDRAQGKLIAVFSAPKQGKPAAVAPPAKKTTAEGSMGQTVSKPTIEGKSSILKPKSGAGVTKKTGSGCVKCQAAGKVEAKKAPRTRTPREMPQGPRRQSERIIDSEQGPAQGQIVAGSAAQEEGGLAATAPPAEKTAKEKATVKAMPPVSKSNGGAGDPKKGGNGGPRGSGGRRSAREWRH